MSDSPADIWSPDIVPSVPHGTMSCSCCHDDSHAALLDVLKSVEWITDRWGVELCPSCGRSADDGHAPDCALDAALRAASP